MANLVVIGAVALDRPVWMNGPVSPGARLRGRTLNKAFAGRLGGGAANAGVALARAGHAVDLAGYIGADADGDAALAQVQAAGLGIAQLHRRPGGGVTLLLIDPAGERLVLGLDAPAAPLPHLPPPDPDATFDGLYVRGSYPGAGAWAEACRGPVVAHWPAGTFAGPCDVLVASAEDCRSGELADPFAAASAQVGARLKWMVVTHGAGDVVAHDGSGSISVAPPPARVVDATGAGDVFAAGLLDALVAGAEIEQALIHACAWGAVTVGLESSAPLTGDFRAFSSTSP